MPTDVMTHQAVQLVLAEVERVQVMALLDRLNRDNGCDTYWGGSLFSSRQHKASTPVAHPGQSGLPRSIGVGHIFQGI